MPGKLKPPTSYKTPAMPGPMANPSLLIYFTDARGIFPKPEPMYPVLWLVKGMSSVPFGERIQLN